MSALRLHSPPLWSLNFHISELRLQGSFTAYRWWTCSTAGWRLQELVTTENSRLLTTWSSLLRQGGSLRRILTSFIGYPGTMKLHLIIIGIQAFCGWVDSRTPLAQLVLLYIYIWGYTDPKYELIELFPGPQTFGWSWFMSVFFIHVIYTCSKYPP